MASVKGDPGIWLYVTAEEQFDWLRDWVHRFRLHFVLARHFPRYKAGHELPWDKPAAARKVLGSFDRLLLDLTPLRTNVTNSNYLTSENPLALGIELPRITREGMHPGHIGFGTKEARHLKIWRAIRQDVIDRTERGLWIRNANNRKKWVDGNLRYTPGVVTAVEGGMALLAAGSLTAHLMSPAERRNWLAKQANVPCVRRYLEPGDPVL